jgi:hypothetical protein
MHRRIDTLDIIINVFIPYIAVILHWLGHAFIETIIMAQRVKHLVYIAILKFYMKKTQSPIVGALLNGHVVTLAAQQYYAHDLHLTTSSAFRWLRNFEESPRVLELVFKAGARGDHRLKLVKVDIYNNVDCLTGKPIRDEDISLDALTEL